MTGTEDTNVAQMARAFTTVHADSSGVHALPKSPEALAARLAFAGMTVRTLDVLYFPWHSDHSRVLLVGRNPS